MHDAQHDGWLTIAEAATSLGCSVDTIRRRIRRGELDAQQVPTQRGPAWRVKLGALPGNLPIVGSKPGSTAMQVEAPLLAQLLADTQAELLRKAEAAAMWQSRAMTLQERVAQLEAQLALPAAPPATAPDARSGPRDGLVIEPAQEPAERQRAWWRFWR